MVKPLVALSLVTTLMAGCTEAELDGFSEEQADSIAEYTVELSANTKFRPLRLNIPEDVTEVRVSGFSEVTSVMEGALGLVSRDIRLPLFAVDKSYLKRSIHDELSTTGVQFSVREKNEEEEWSGWTPVELPGLPEGAYFTGIHGLDPIEIDSSARTITGAWAFYGTDFKAGVVEANIPATKQYMELQVLVLPLVTSGDFEQGQLFETEWKYGRR